MDNITEYLKLSGWTQANALKNSVLSLISKNRLHMKKTDWNQLLEDQPQLLIEVVNCLLDSAIHVQSDASSTNSLANDFVHNVY